MPNIEITWTRETEDGEKLHICARSRGDHWVFSSRMRRFDTWRKVAHPLLEDWLVLLDGVRRRGGRYRFDPRDEARLIAHIRRLFPQARIGARGEPQ